MALLIDRLAPASGVRKASTHFFGAGGRFLAQTTELLRFIREVLVGLPKVRHDLSEVVRQSGTLVMSTGLLLCGMQFLGGLVVGVEGHYITGALGAPQLSGVVGAWATLRVYGSALWAWVLAAKVGCGIVAEIGSMRINEEIDALRVLGIDPKSYLVGTRVVAAWITLPFLYVAGTAIMSFGTYIPSVIQFGSVSPGGYLQVFWAFQTPGDLLFSAIMTIAMGTVIVFVSCYFGFTATGGPVGVGENTAKSMMVNMVLVAVVAAAFVQLFWGITNANVPISN